MSDMKKEAEAILFSAGRAVSSQEIESLIPESSPESVRDAVGELRKEYDERESPLLIVEEGEGWKLTVKEKYLQVVQRINPHTELSKAVMETLAVIAWKQPALQSDVIKIRTNKAYEHIKELDTLGFISKEREGRSYRLKTTSKFMDYFDLPDPKAVKELFKDFDDVELPKDIKDEMEGKETALSAEPDKLGKLEVYDEGVQTPAFSGEHAQDAGERLGDLDVYAERVSTEQEAAPEETTTEEAPSPEEQVSAEDQERLKAKELAESLLGEQEKKEETPEEEESTINPALEQFEHKVASEEKAEDEKMVAKVSPGEHAPEESAEPAEESSKVATEEPPAEESSDEAPPEQPTEEQAELESGESSEQKPAETDKQEADAQDTSFEEKPIVDVAAEDTESSAEQTGKPE